MKEYLTVRNGGIGLLGFSGLTVLLDKLGFLANGVDAQKFIIVLVSGLAMTLWPNLSSVLTKLTGNDKHNEVLDILKNMNKTTGDAQSETPSFELNENQLKDIEVVNYLAYRFDAANDSDGMDLCRKVQDRLFSIHHPQKTVSNAVGGK